MRVAQMLDPVTLESAQIVGVAELGSQQLEDITVPLLALGAERLTEVATEGMTDLVVVE